MISNLITKKVIPITAAALIMIIPSFQSQAISSSTSANISSKTQHLSTGRVANFNSNAGVRNYPTNPSTVRPPSVVKPYTSGNNRRYSRLRYRNNRSVNRNAQSRTVKRATRKRSSRGRYRGRTNRSVNINGNRRR